MGRPCSELVEGRGKEKGEEPQVTSCTPIYQPQPQPSPLTSSREHTSELQATAQRGCYQNNITLIPRVEPGQGYAGTSQLCSSVSETYYEGNDTPPQYDVAVGDTLEPSAMSEEALTDTQMLEEQTVGSLRQPAALPNKG
ncbi:hypothetical protein EJ110_NYTH23583 [Nymphaea thermarum]|nr:hypothetical protein EJ110_NYTH23583 [Nymphaea thermarum]